MRKPIWIVTSAFLLVSHYTTNLLAWDPDAGYVESWTKRPGVTVSTSTNQDQALKIIDSNDNTPWMSGSCLPSGYVSRADENVLKGVCGTGQCSDSLGSDLSKMTDSNFYTTAQINVNTSQSSAELNIKLMTPTALSLLSIWGIYKGATTLTVQYSNHSTETIMVLDQADNYKQITASKSLHGVVKISIQSSQSFQIKEISSLGISGCKEHLTVDLGAIRKIGVVRSRHWAGTNSATELSMSFSTNNITWGNKVALVPDALHAVTSDITPEVSARYLRLVYTLAQRKYNKVYCWEIDAWNQERSWGAPINALPQTETIRAMLGVNGIWGWQHSKFSDSLKVGEGPFLYNAIASHARNYHNLDWDVTDPTRNPEFEQMANGGGTQAKGWLNWDKEYTAWRNAGLQIDASWQFTNKSFPQHVWSTDPEKAAYDLGRHFSLHFGQEHGVGLIDAVEVGNEPWDYEATFYNKVLKGMSAGLRGGDSKIKILPGAFQADNKHDTNNYIGSRVTEDLAQNISIINFHTYSFMTNGNGIRVATYPEHPDSSFNSIRNIVRWRDINTQSKPIWVTEWGWDADGKGEDCSFPECVSEKAQALYGIRGLLILARSNVQKVTWFFYANSEYCSTLFCRSGLTASKHHGFAKKNVFVAFEELLNIIGDKYFLGVLMENNSSYVYMYGSSPANSTQFKNIDRLLHQTSHIVAWKPIDVSDTSTSTIEIPLPSLVSHVSVKQFTGDNPATSNHQVQIPTLKLQISAQPIVVELHHTGVGQIVG